MTTITSNESYILKALQAQAKEGGLLEGYEVNLRTVDKPSSSYNTIGIRKMDTPIEVNIQDGAPIKWYINCRRSV